MKLRLYHHHDGARVAYREAGTGPPLALLHSPGLSHREFAPVADELAERYRLVLPDLPGHGDSEDRPRHPWTPEWLAEVIAGFCGEVLGPRPLVGGHDVGAELLLRAAAAGWLRPRKVVLMSSRLHTEMPRGHKIRTWRAVTRAAVVPGLDRALAGMAPAVFRPAVGIRLSARGNPGRLRAVGRPRAPAVGGRGPALPGVPGRGCPRPPAERPAPRARRRGLPDGLRRPGRRGTRARCVLPVRLRRSASPACCAACSPRPSPAARWG